MEDIIQKKSDKLSQNLTPIVVILGVVMSILVFRKIINK
jgi:hypothetical protein